MFVGVFGVAQVTFAAARSVPFIPGQTIDPGTDSQPCGPLDANCFPSVAGTAGLSSLNGLISAAQIFASSTSGNDFSITSFGSTHTFNLPTASGIVRGLLSAADWNTFNSKLSALSIGSTVEAWNAALDTFAANGPAYYLNAANHTNFGAPFYAFFNATTTDALAEGTTNRYYTDARVNSFVAASSTIPKTYSNNTWTGANTFGAATSTSFAVTGVTSSLLKTNAGGSLVPAVAGADYQAAGSYLTAVTADGPLSGAGTAASHLTMSQAGTGANGYLSFTDWNTFNNKASTTIANSWTALQTFGNNISFGGAQVNTGTLSPGDLFSYNGTYWVNVATSSLNITSNLGNVTGALAITNGGTGATSFGQGWLYSNGGTSAVSASTSPTVAYITATSATATSTFAGAIYTKDPIADIRSFGAIGDGTTDNTTAVQAALNFSLNVFIPSGIYVVSNLTTKQGQLIYGAGASSTLLFKTGSTGYMFEDGTNSVRYSNLDLDGGNDTDQSGTVSAGNRSGIHVSAINPNNSITNVSVHGFSNIGIGFNGIGSLYAYPGAPTIENVNVYWNYEGIDTGVGDDATGMTTTAEYLKLTNITAYQNRIGLMVNSGNDTITGSHFDTNGYGVIVTDAYNNAHGTIIGSTINHDSILGLYASSTSAGFTFTGNQVWYSNVLIATSTGWTITNNTFVSDTIRLNAGGANMMKNNWFGAGNTIVRNGDNFIMADNYKNDGSYDQNLQSLIVQNNIVSYSTTTGTLTVGTMTTGNQSTLKLGVNQNRTNPAYVPATLSVLDVAGTSGAPATSGTTPTGMARFGANDGFSSGLYLGNYTTAPYGIWMQASDFSNLSLKYPIILQPNGGNIGIGTTSPYAKLSILGTANASTPLFAIASTTGNATTTVFQIDQNGLLTMNTPGATSTITGSLRVIGGFRADSTYTGDLIFGNGFRFTEASSTVVPQSLYLQNQNGQNVLNVDEHGNLNLLGDVCSGSSSCFGETLNNLSADVTALASTTAQEQAVTFSGLSARINDLILNMASTTLNLQNRISNLETLSSTTAGTTATALSSSPSFIQQIASAVENLIQSAGNFVVNSITAVTARFTDVEGDTIHGRSVQGSTVEADTLCVGHTCVTETELQALLQNAHVNSAAVPTTSTTSQVASPITVSSTTTVEVSTASASTVSVASSTEPVSVSATPESTSTPATAIVNQPATSTPEVTATPASVSQPATSTPPAIASPAPSISTSTTPETSVTPAPVTSSAPAPVSEPATASTTASTPAAPAQ